MSELYGKLSSVDSFNWIYTRENVQTACKVLCPGKFPGFIDFSRKTLSFMVIAVADSFGLTTLLFHHAKNK